MILGMLTGIAFAVLSVASVLGVVILVINMLKNKKKDGEFDIKMLWTGYLYVMSLLTLLIALFGGARVLKAGFSYMWGPQFSYQLNEYDSKEITDEFGKPTSIEDSWLKGQTEVNLEGKTYYFDETERKSDMIDGATTFLSLLILFAIHRAISLKVDEEAKGGKSMWARIYNFISLLLYGILSIVVIPASIYELVKYFVEGTSNLTYGSPVPGASLAALIMIVPIWLIFLMRMVKMSKK